MKTKLKIFTKIIGGLGLFVAPFGVVGSLTTLVVIPKLKTEAEKKVTQTLTPFVSEGGDFANLRDEPIRYVALGDSLTAGYNGILSKDHLSYADFISQSLKNVNKLGSYHNYATTGATMPDIKKNVFGNTSRMRQIRKANLISITIGANDILAVIRVLNIPFLNILRFLTEKQQDKIKNNPLAEAFTFNKLKNKYLPTTNFNRDHPKAWDNIFGKQWKFDEWDWKKHREKVFQKDNFSPAIGFSKKDTYELVAGSLTNFKRMINGEPEASINIDPDWFPAIFDVIGREMAILVNDLQISAPKAQIVVLGHGWPFVQLNDKFFKNPKKELNNKSVEENYSILLDTMKKGVEASLGKNNFVSFFKIDELPNFKKNNIKVDFTNKNKFVRKTPKISMPNLTDIHPSIFGHEMIGKDLFAHIGKWVGLTEPEIQRATQKSYPPNQIDLPETPKVNENHWARIDETKEMLGKLYDLTGNIYQITMFAEDEASDLFSGSINSILISGGKTFAKILVELIEDKKVKSVDGSILLAKIFKGVNIFKYAIAKIITDLTKKVMDKTWASLMKGQILDKLKTHAHSHGGDQTNEWKTFDANAFEDAFLSSPVAFKRLIALIQEALTWKELAGSTFGKLFVDTTLFFDTLGYIEKLLKISIDTINLLKRTLTQLESGVSDKTVSEMDQYKLFEFLLYKAGNNAEEATEHMMGLTKYMKELFYEFVVAKLQKTLNTSKTKDRKKLLEELDIKFDELPEATRKEWAKKIIEKYEEEKETTSGSSTS